MKIVKIDNFDRDFISDELIAENVLKYYADEIVKMLNSQCSGSNSPDYFEVKPDDYKLYTFEP